MGRSISTLIAHFCFRQLSKQGAPYSVTHYSYLICPIPFFPSEAFMVTLGDEFMEEYCVCSLSTFHRLHSHQNIGAA